MFMPYYRR